MCIQKHTFYMSTHNLACLLSIEHEYTSCGGLVGCWHWLFVPFLVKLCFTLTHTSAAPTKNLHMLDA